MATTFAQMTADEFELLPKGGRKLELDEGVIVEVEMALAEHELVKLKLTTLLARALPESVLRSAAKLSVASAIG